jgi:asparagine synthase (glutamine-hydrolysing)
MCGICGIYNHGVLARPADRQLVQRMMDAMASRGPDDQGLQDDGPLALGFRRLSIVDLSPAGHQPMTDEGGALWLALNGEIYNAPALRRELLSRGHAFRSGSDAETVLHLYQELGAALVQRLDGMFAFALWDREKKQLLLARDRMGIKPLYYHLDGERVAFASSFRSLLCDPSITRQIDPAALNDYFALRYVPAPDTMISGVKKLMPGHWMTVTPGTITTRQYWDIPVDGPKRSFAAAQADLKSALDNAVSSHLMSDVPVAAFLSGGVDSSIVVGAMVKAGARPETFSAGFGDDPEFTELAYAKLVADHWGLKNHQVLIGPAEFESSLSDVVHALEEPIADPAAVPGYFLSRLAGQQFKVVLTGEGADETFGGYKRYCWANRRQGWLAPLSAMGPGPARLAGRMGFDYFRLRTAQFLTIPAAMQAYLENVSLFNFPERRGILGPAARDAIGDGRYPQQPDRKSVV